MGILRAKRLSPARKPPVAAPLGTTSLVQFSFNSLNLSRIGSTIIFRHFHLKTVLATVTRAQAAFTRAPFALAAGVGALCGIIACMTLGGFIAPANLPAIVAPIGASSVLVFAVPASPLATPRAVIGGNTLSAAVGISIGLLVANPLLAAGLAVGLAIMLMAATRTLHPPGGAAALTGVLLHPATLALQTDALFPLLPVCVNSLTLVAVGIVFHRLSGHSYPHRPAPLPAKMQQAAGIERADITAALAKANDVFDIAPQDLERLLVLAEEHARQHPNQKP